MMVTISLTLSVDLQKNLKLKTNISKNMHIYLLEVNRKYSKVSKSLQPSYFSSAQFLFRKKALQYFTLYEYLKPGSFKVTSRSNKKVY